MTWKGTRRDFLRGGPRAEPARQANQPPAGAAPLPRVIAWLNDPPEAAAPVSPHAPLPLLRPPGAIREDQFVKDCTRCAACIEACPHDTLRPAPARYRGAAGTPIIDPAEAPCRLCEDWPCIQACPAGVLVLQGAAAMGTARVQVHDCLNALGTSCRVCIEQCPVPGALTLQGRTVVVHEAMCTGCGVCQYVCPAPNNAVLILPTRQRPARNPDPEAAHD